MRAAIYARLSTTSDAEDGGSIQQQVADAEDEIASRSWILVEPVFKETASAAKRRPRWEALLAEIDAGRVDVVVARHIDRMMRSTRDLDALIDLAERMPGGIVLTHGGDLDLSTATGRGTARIVASVAQMEREMTSERMRSAFQRKAKAGSRHASRPLLGWEKITKRRIVAGSETKYEVPGDKLDPVEAPLMQKAAQMILGGATLADAARTFRDAGVVMPSGREVTGSELKRMLLHPRTIGKRSVGVYETLKPHQHRNGKRPRKLAERVESEGTWEPILDTSTQDRLRAVLSDPKRLARVGGHPVADNVRRVNWASAVARCGLCGGRLRSQYRPRVFYSCIVSKGGCGNVSIDADTLETTLDQYMYRRVTMPESRKAIAATQTDGHIADLTIEVETLRSRRSEIATLMASGTLAPDVAAEAVAKIDEAITRLNAEMARRIAATATATIPDIDPDLWNDLTANERKKLALALIDQATVSAHGEIEVAGAT